MSIETVAAAMGFSAAQALALEQACIRFGIVTPLQHAHFLAQVAHESAAGRYMEEIASGKAYEGRTDLGNTQPGDGIRFKGRGLIQLTGRANYGRYSTEMYGDARCVQNPSMVAELPDAALAAGWFWERMGLNAWADRDDVLAVSRGVNRGSPTSSGTPNGLADRKQWLGRVKALILELGE